MSTVFILYILDTENRGSCLGEFGESDIYSFFSLPISVKKLRNPIEYLKEGTGNSLAAHCLRLLPSNARGMSSIPGQGQKIPCLRVQSRVKKNKQTFFGGTCNMGKSFYTIWKS